MKKIVYIYLFILSACSAQKVPPIWEKDCYENTNNPVLMKTKPYELEADPYMYADPTGSCELEFTSTQKYFYEHPVFNPNNPNQIAFVRQTSSKPYVWELCTFNLCTNEFKVLTNQIFTSSLSWGKNDYLIFNGKSNACKVKSNGDSLANIREVSGYIVSWDTEGKCFYYYTGYRKGILVNVKEGTQEVVFDNIIGDLMLQPNISKVDIAHENILYENAIGIDAIRINTYSMNEKIHKSIAYYSTPALSGLNSQGFSYNEVSNFNNKPQWVQPDTTFLWCSRRKIFLTNILTHKTDTILRMADNIHFHDFDISPNGKKILCSRWEEKAIPPHQIQWGGFLIWTNHKVESNRYLCIMNIDGTEMRDIIIPE